MRIRLIVILVVATIAPAAPASAHGVTATITPPAVPVVEDSAFPIEFAGDVSSLPYGEGYVEARIRAGVQTPCAATELQDPGAHVLVGPPGANHVHGAFSVVGSYEPDEPGEYLICAWIVDGLNESGPPVATTMTVRPPVLRLAATAPAGAKIGEPFTVTVDYEAEVSRFLTVLILRGTRCPLASRILGAIFGQPAIVADNAEVVGPGSATRTVRLPRAGTYAVCGYLDEQVLGSERADLVVKAATVVVEPLFRACASVGGRRQIHGVRARDVSCVAARSVARRWGAPRRAPRRVGAYRCFARSGSVTCTAGSAQVRFRYARR